MTKILKLVLAPLLALALALSLGAFASSATAATHGKKGQHGHSKAMKLQLQAKKLDSGATMLKGTAANLLATDVVTLEASTDGVTWTTVPAHFKKACEKAKNSKAQNGKKKPARTCAVKLRFEAGAGQWRMSAVRDGVTYSTNVVTVDDSTATDDSADDVNDDNGTTPEPGDDSTR